MKIKELLRINIEEEVPLVIKAGEQDLEVEQNEISQYIVTHQIERHLEDFLNNYKLPSTDRIGVWISGFFGSGKSYFAKILGYLLSNHTLPRGITARELFNERIGNCSAPEFLKGAIESLNRISAKIVMFEIIAEGSLHNDTVQQVIFKKLLQAYGYSPIPSVGVMEYELDSFGHLDTIRDFVATQGAQYAKITQNAGEFRRFVTKAMSEKLGYRNDEAQAFLTSAMDKYEKLSPASLAEYCVEFTRKTEHRLVLIIDEIGQYVTSIKDNDDRILHLQGVAEAFASKGKGAVRLIVTSQEKLDQLIANSNFDKRKLGKLTDRFEVRLDLTSENVDEVARERLLKKKLDTESLFTKTLKDHEGNITTISNTDGSYKKTETKDQFMTYYPFHPYHFQLLPDLVQNTRTSSYQQATARKFIFLVDSILKKLKDEAFGRIVSATDLFDALGSNFFGSEVMGFVNSAQDYLGERVKASDILKTLHILKNLTKIAATQTVITRMLCKNIFDKQYELTSEVKAALDYLEKTRYISRYNGEITLVTDLERELIEEMEATIVNLPRKNEEINRQLLHILPYKELQYEEGPSVPIEWYEESNAIGGKKGGLKVKILPFEKANAEGCEYESMNHNDTVYAIPQENETIDTLAREVKRLESSLNTFRTKKTGGDIREILTKYGKMMEDKKSDLAREIRQSVETGRLIYAGETIQGGNLLNALKSLLKERVILAHYTEITSAKALPKDIEGALTQPQNHLKTLRVDEDHRVFDENGELIETHKIISPIIQFLHEDRTGSDLLEHFSIAPYGWAQETILFAVACLMRGGKITINHLDAYHKPEVHKALTKSISDFKNARIRKNIVLSADQRHQLIQLINPLLEEGRLTLQSPRSEFISRALEGARHLDKRLTDLKKKMEELGANVDWELHTIRNAINTLTGGGDDCLESLLKQGSVIQELNEAAEKTEAFLKQQYERIRKQKGFLKEIEGEIAKGAFESRQSVELATLAKEYADTLPRIASFGTDLDGIFERLRNTYKAMFSSVHEERNKGLREIHKYLVSIQDKTNDLGQKAKDQSWFKRPGAPCEQLKIGFSTSCESCHIGFREATLERMHLENERKSMESSFEELMQQRPDIGTEIVITSGTAGQEPPTIAKPPINQTTKLKLKNPLTYRELMKEIESLGIEEDTKIEIELED